MNTPSVEPGVLWGVGVGPGDPELVTLKAVDALRACRIYAHFAKAGKPGNARSIAQPHLPDEARELRLEYPFTIEIPLDDPRYPAEMAAFYDTCAERVAAELDTGQSVAVLCEGDPFLYGSYMYLHDRLSPRYETHVIPGVTGMSGCWTAANAPITHGDDVLTVLPGTLPEAEISTRVEKTDAAVIMKVGRNLPKISEALSKAGRQRDAIVVERGTMDGETVTPLQDWQDGRVAPYFSIVLVPGRRGVR
ncbi:MAG: precorrin-2 C(20)-methyltransferase [Pseudomonadota bacterium]